MSFCIYVAVKLIRYSNPQKLLTPVDAQTVLDFLIERVEADDFGGECMRQKADKRDDDENLDLRIRRQRRENVHAATDQDAPEDDVTHDNNGNVHYANACNDEIIH